MGLVHCEIFARVLLLPEHNRIQGKANIHIFLRIYYLSLVASLMSPAASLVTTGRCSNVFNAFTDISKVFLLLFHCCILLEIKLTTTTTTKYESLPCVVCIFQVDCNFIKHSCHFANQCTKWIASKELPSGWQHHNTIKLCACFMGYVVLPTIDFLLFPWSDDKIDDCPGSLSNQFWVYRRLG